MTTKTIDAPAVEAPVEAPRAPEDKPSPMKLSEALRIGSMNTVQAHGTWSKTSGKGGTALMCAISTAWYALTGDDRGAAGSELNLLLSTVTVTNPVTHQAAPLGAVIVHLNDSHKWSRAKIADWLEGLGL